MDFHEMEYETLCRKFQAESPAEIRTRKYCRPNVETLESRVTPANVPILSNHYDAFLTGANTQETILNPAMSTRRTGNLFNYAVDGYVFAQPLYMPDLTIAGHACRLCRDRA